MDGFANGRIGVALTRNNHAEAAFHRAKGGRCLSVVGFKSRERAVVAALPECARWVPVQVYSGLEFKVADDLSAVPGLFGYAPHRTVVHGKARVEGSNSVRRPVRRDYAIVPGYVFVGCQDGVYVSKRSHDAIFNVLGDAAGRTPVTQATMAAWNALHVEGALQPAAPAGLAKGDRIEVEVAGKRVAGIVTALRRAGVMVDATMFGQTVPIEIGFDKIKAVAV